MSYGILCLLPPAAMLIFALKTKKSFEALIFGTLIAYIIMYKTKFIGPWCDLLLSEVSNEDNQYILLLCGLFGGFIFLLREAKGTLGFSDLLSRFCKSECITMLVSVFMGIIIFVDDYLNIMTVGTCMKDVCDKRKVPRQALAYIIDSTGAPICALIPFSTWVVFYSGVFIQEQAIVDMGFDTGMSVYLKVLPYMFYPIAALLIVILFALKLMPKIGKMREAYEELGKKELVPEKPEMHNAPSVNIAMAGMSVDYPPENHNTGNILDFLIPIGILIGVTVYTQNMMVAIILALASCMILYIPRKKMTFTRYVELFFAGFADILPVLAILLASFMIKTACGEMGLSEYIINLCVPYMNGKTLAAIIFLVIAVLTFVTSSFWGIEAVAVSIVVPLAVALNANVLLALGAVVSGGVFGSHACFYSDATVLSSATCEIDNMSHAVSQFPYVLISAVLAAGCFLFCGVFGF
ncbi:MAG: Na+/H+ antiporter NhaC family protein [Lachnospiraceae bacterium]|nr:Na+/H+ antiporter NhaC family protein [Lachnospiraceae bacterium]